MWSDLLVPVIVVFILSALWWRRIRGLLKLPDGKDSLRGKLDLVLMGRAMLSKSLIQFSVDGWGCVPSLLFDLRLNGGGGKEDNGNLLQKVPCMCCCTECPRPCSRPLPSHTSAGDPQTLTDIKVMTNIDSILKGRDITFPTKIRIVKAVIFLVVM